MSHVANESKLDVHVVILNNYIRRHHVVAYRALAKHVRKLTILLSTQMEPDRDWNAEWDDLNVIVQKNWMWTTKWRHSSGFEEPNFIHIPIDTTAQLKRLKPDIIFSYEFGMRTLFCSWFRRFNPTCPLVMVGNMSEHIENERGVGRRILRGFLKSKVDYFTYNGPSCRRYLEKLGVEDNRLFFVPYCIDPEKSFEGHKSFSSDGVRRLVYCGALSPRKGVLQFVKLLSEYVEANPQSPVQFDICGEGPEQEQIEQFQSDALKIVFHGHCDPDELKSIYSTSDVCVYPSLADEWGLVPIEAMASGLPVLGSVLAQAVEVHCQENETGWPFDPRVEGGVKKAIQSAIEATPDHLQSMSLLARERVNSISPEKSAGQFLGVIKSVSKPGVGAGEIVSEFKSAVS